MQISVDLLNIVLQRDANWRCKFPASKFEVNPKWPWKFPTPKFARGNTNNHSVQLIENDDGIFQRQNFGWYKWRRKFPKAESGVNRKWPWKFPTSKLRLMQNDRVNFQGKHFELSKWPWKFPTSKLWVIQDDHRNFQIQIWSSCKMTLEISKVKINLSLIQTTMEIYAPYLKWLWNSTA